MDVAEAEVEAARARKEVPLVVIGAAALGGESTESAQEQFLPEAGHGLEVLGRR